MWRGGLGLIVWTATDENGCGEAGGAGCLSEEVGADASAVEADSLNSKGITGENSATCFVGAFRCASKPENCWGSHLVNEIFGRLVIECLPSGSPIPLDTGTGSRIFRERRPANMAAGPGISVAGVGLKIV